MQQLNSLFQNKYQIVGQKADKTRWDSISDIASIIGRPPMYVSTRLKGFKAQDVEDLLIKGKRSFNARNELYRLIEDCRIK